MYPGECDYQDFLQVMGWADIEVLERQPLHWHERQWRIYQFKAETGLLHTGGLF